MPFVQEEIGARIGRYKVLEKVGEGGFGVVYVAEQREPVKRRVALKVIKLGMDTRQVVARFEAERQALAMMDHPNIAKVLDAGATDTGRPYFVMELVRGIRITEYCDQHKLSTEQRLELFIQVCHAIQHAHQKGIIHRDIKPSNILVTLHDGVPVPKVIDFGIAKATQQELTEKTLYTQLQQFIGTPAYMSPEQAEMSGLDIDTRSDIYSLGVLLYELMTGRTPFDGTELMSQGIDAMRKAIREKEPQKPSTRVATLNVEELSITAARHSADPPKLVHLLKGDLDWIVMKCLEKDRTRRYETANGLGMDIQRHLNNEAVSARSPSAAYRFERMIRRNKVAFAAGTAVAGVLILGAVASTWQAIRATRSERAQSVLRQQAEESRNNEAKLRGQAQIDEAKAKTEAARSAQYALFMREMLQGVGPSVALGRDTQLLKEIVTRTEGRLATQLQDQPEVIADLRDTLGSVYVNLGEYGHAEMLLREALEARRKLFGNESAEVATTLDTLGDDLMYQASLTEAESDLREALAIRRKLSGEASDNVASTLEHLSAVLLREQRQEETVALRREALEIYRKLYGEENAKVAQSMGDLASALRSQHKFEEAEGMFRQALAMQRRLIGEEDPETISTLSSLGLTLQNEKKYAEAIEVLQQALALRRKVLGEEHPQVAMSLLRVANSLVQQKKNSEAIADLREAVEIQQKSLGDNPDAVEVLVTLAKALDREGGHEEEAEKLARDAAAMELRLASKGAPPLGRGSTLLSDLLQKQGKAAESAQIQRELLEQLKVSLGPDHLNTLRAMDNVAWNDYLQGDAAIGLPIAEEAVRRFRATLGTRNINTISAMDTLAWIYEDLGQLDKAVPLFEEIRQCTRETHGTEDGRFTYCMASLAHAYMEVGRMDEARQLLAAALALSRAANATLAIGRDLAFASEVCLREKDFAGAEKLLRAAPGIEDEGNREVPMVDWARSLLGEALVGQGKFAEAEPVLTDAYVRLVKLAPIVTFRNQQTLLSEAKDRVVQLYVAWGKPEKAEEWRKVDLSKAGAVVPKGVGTGP